MMEDDIEDVVPKDGLPEGPGVGRSTHSDMMVKGNFASLQHVPEAVDEAKDQNTPGLATVILFLSYQVILGSHHFHLEHHGN